MTQREAALKDLEHPDSLQQILALCWMMSNKIEVLTGFCLTEEYANRIRKMESGR